MSGIEPEGKTPLRQFMDVCEELHEHTDEELEAQLRQVAVARPTEMVSALRLVLQSTLYLRQQLAPTPDEPVMPSPTQPPHSLLSAREREILALVARGYTLPQIGDKLFISPATVNNHCARIREKLGLRGRNALMVYAVSLEKN